MKTIVLTGLLAICAVTAANAQIMVHGPHGPVVVPSQGQHAMAFRPQYGQYPPFSQHLRPQASGPAIVSSNQVSSVDLQTGAVNTSNFQIDHSTFAPGRADSMHNGTKRWVKRPIHNMSGQVVGYQEGWVWNNSMTGQEHGSLQNYTPNGLGGVHVQQQIRSRANSSQGIHPSQSSARPQGIHTQFQSYGGGR